MPPLFEELAIYEPLWSVRPSDLTRAPFSSEELEKLTKPDRRGSNPPGRLFLCCDNGILEQKQKLWPKEAVVLAALMSADCRADVGLVVFLAKTLCVPDLCVPVGISSDGQHLYSEVVDCFGPGYGMTSPNVAQPSYRLEMLPTKNQLEALDLSSHFRVLEQCFIRSFDLFTYIFPTLRDHLYKHIELLHTPSVAWEGPDAAVAFFMHVLDDRHRRQRDQILSDSRFVEVLNVVLEMHHILWLGTKKGLVSLCQRVGVDLTRGYTPAFYTALAAYVPLDGIQGFLAECKERAVSKIPLRAQDICLGGDLDCIRYAHERGLPMSVDEQSFFVNLKQYLKWWRIEPTVEGFEFFLSLGVSVKGKGRELLLAACRATRRWFPNTVLLQRIITADPDFFTRTPFLPHSAFRQGLHVFSLCNENEANVQLAEQYARFFLDLCEQQGISHTTKGHSLLSLLISHPCIQRPIVERIYVDWNDLDGEPTLGGYSQVDNRRPSLSYMPEPILAMVKVLAPSDYRLKHCVWSVLKAGHVSLFTSLMECGKVPFSLRYRESGLTLYQFAAEHTRCSAVIETLFSATVGDDGQPLAQDVVQDCCDRAVRCCNAPALMVLSRLAPVSLNDITTLYILSIGSHVKPVLYMFLKRLKQDANPAASLGQRCGLKTNPLLRSRRIWYLS